MKSKDEPRILIIEDHDVLRVLMFTLLRHEPLGVDIAATADEALQKVTSCDYALIVIDMDMADSEAARFLREFRAERPEATTFILAVCDPAGDTPVDPEIVSAMLTKPIDLQTLADIVRETAQVVPPPPDPLHCPPAENDTRWDLGDAITN
jgi:CheY-like chemotaxis protein